MSSISSCSVGVWYAGYECSDYTDENNEINLTQRTPGDVLLTEDDPVFFLSKEHVFYMYKDGGLKSHMGTYSTIFGKLSRILLLLFALYMFL